MESCLCLVSSFLRTFCCTIDYKRCRPYLGVTLFSQMIQRYAYKLRAIMKDAVGTSRPCNLHTPGACAPGSPQPSSSQLGTMVGPGLWLPGRWWAKGSWERTWQEPPALLGSHHRVLSLPALTCRTALVPQALSSTPCWGGHSPTSLRAPAGLWPVLAPSGVLEHVEQSYSNFRSCLMIFLYDTGL